MPSLSDLISNREFSQYYDNGLTSRFNALRVMHELVYSEKSANPSLQLTLQNESYIYKLVLWESGDCNIEALELETGKKIFNEQFQFESSSQFFEKYPEAIVRLFSFDKRT